MSIVSGSDRSGIEEKEKKVFDMLDRELASIGLDAKDIVSRLKTSNKGSIATTLRVIDGKGGPELLREVVELYAEFQYLEVKRAVKNGDPEEYRKDLLTIKFVLQEYNGIFNPGKKLQPWFMQDINNKLKEIG